MVSATGAMDIEFSFNETQLANITQRFDDFAGRIELILDHLKTLNSRLADLEVKSADDTETQCQQPA